MIITNLPPAAYEASRSCRLFVSNYLLHSFYCFEYNLTITVTVYFRENFNDKLQDRKWLLLITEYYAFTICVDLVNFFA